MGDVRGFLKVARQEGCYRPVCERINDFERVFDLRADGQSREQASRCMDCGTPFCHWACPAGNYIPEWNDHMFRGKWDKAFELLEATNRLAEITGRICPAPCEYSCVLGLNDEAVTIRENELAIAEFGFRNGLIKPDPVKARTGKKVAIVGSGPAGLSCAADLNKMGHSVTVFERDNKPGGILRYGIPDFKLEKDVLDRRIGIWIKEGVMFRTSTEIGKDCPLGEIVDGFDAVLLAGGSRVPRDIDIEGRQLKGIYFAMDYLTQSNRRVSGEKISRGHLIDAKDRKVVVIGGGDTGADCVGTAHRQGAACVVQIEVLRKPPLSRAAAQPWPVYPSILKTTSSHEEGGQRYWEVVTKRFIGEKGVVKKLSCLRAGDEFEIESDMVVIAIGFLHPEHPDCFANAGIKYDDRGNVRTDSNFMTPVDKIFSAGDMRRGQSLVVWAIAEGKTSAYHINRYLRGGK